MKWERVALGDVLAESLEVQGRRTRLEPLTLTEGRGFMLQRDKFKKRVALEDTANYKVVRRGSIAFNPYLLWAGAIAQNNLWDEAVVSPAYPVFTPRENADSRYLWHMLQSPLARAEFDSISFGAIPRRRRAATADFLRLRLPLPPLSEQRRIAAILDEAEALRATQTRAVRACTTLAEAAFRELEGSLDGKRAVPLDDIAIVASGITKGRKAPPGPLSSVDYMTVANVQDKRLDLSVVKQIDVSAVELERYRLQRGDLLLTEGGDPDKLGRGVVWNEERTDAIHQNHVFRVRMRDPARSPVWLSWEVGSAYGKRYFLRMAKQTTGIATINSTQLRAFPVRVPDAGAVERFLASLENVRRVQADGETRSLLLDSLFASLQHRAFRGEI